MVGILYPEKNTILKKVVLSYGGSEFLTILVFKWFEIVWSRVSANI
jgi:hypothetical protein